MLAPLMLNNSMPSSPAIESAEFVTQGNVRTQLSLYENGIRDVANNLILGFESVIGVKREGSKLTYVSYPKVLEPTSSCCVTGNEIRQRSEHSYVCNSEETAKQWETSSWNILQKELIQRTGRHTRRFLVFLNPKSGKGRSESIFNDHCLPMFRDAGIECTLVKTEFCGHASKMCKETADIAAKYDGIVIVSGDGLLFEVIQGLMTRPDWATVMKSVALGVIPGGSGNGLAVSLAHAGGERRGPVSNAFLIAKGYEAPMDICAVDHFGKGRLYSFLSLEFGFVADIDIGSEWMRSLGEVRFTLEAILLMFSPNSTRCRFSYLPVAGSPPSPMMAPRIPSYWESGGYEGPEGPKTLLSNPLNAPIPSDWVTLEDRFYFMWHANVAWMSSNGHVSPHSRWNDGYLQLCFYRKSKSRFARLNLLKFLLALETGGHIRDDGLASYKAIEMFPTRAYRIEPLRKTKTRVAVDGELVELGPIQMEVLPGLARLMGTLDINPRRT